MLKHQHGKNELLQKKNKNVVVRHEKTPISLGSSLVCSDSSLSASRTFGPSFPIEQMYQFFFIARLPNEPAVFCSIDILNKKNKTSF